MTLQNGIALQFLLKLGNQKPRRSDFHVVCKPNNEACRWHNHQMNCLGHKEETFILVSVAKLLRLSICFFSYFPFWFRGQDLVLIVLVPGYCFLFF